MFKKTFLTLALVAGALFFAAPSQAQAQDFGVRIGGRDSGFSIWIGGGNGRWDRNGGGWNRGCDPRWDNRCDPRSGGWNRGCDPRWDSRCDPRGGGYGYNPPIQVQVIVGYNRFYDRYYGWVSQPVYGTVWAHWNAYYRQYTYTDPMTGRRVAVYGNNGGYRRW